MTDTDANNPGGRRAAALHRQGDQWRLVILETASAPQSLRLLASISLAKGDTARLRASLQQHGVSRLLRILPASAVICRVVEAPSGNESDVAAALSLIAEATLPASLPPHRRAAARLPTTIVGHPSTGLILAWTGDPPEPAIAGIEESWTAEPVALLHFINAQTRAALFADRASASLSVIASGPKRLALRALRESSADHSGWLGTINERFEQTASACGVTLNGALRACDEGDIALRFDAPPDSVLRGIDGASGDSAWLAHFGLALAAAAASLSAAPSTRPLFTLTADPPRVDEPSFIRFSRMIARPRRASWIIAASLAAALVAPLGIAAARHAVLASKSGGLDRQQQLDRQESLRAAFIEQLDKRRWPMTPILADLTAALPIGVTLESFRLEVGQRVALRGRAESLELVNQLQSKLNDSGVFAEASIDRTQKTPDASTVEFDASARVVRPFGPARGLDNFAELTLAQRLYGDRAGLSQAASDVPRADSRAPRADATTPERQRASRAEPKPADIPPPITDEEIKALDAAAAMKQWTNRQKASKQSGLDAATRDRLKDEAEKCRARMLEARKGGST